MFFGVATEKKVAVCAEDGKQLAAAGENVLVIQDYTLVHLPMLLHHSHVLRVVERLQLDQVRVDWVYQRQVRHLDEGINQGLVALVLFRRGHLQMSQMLRFQRQRSPAPVEGLEDCFEFF